MAETRKKQQAPRQIIYQQQPTLCGQCSSHEMFEQLIRQSIENLSVKFDELVATMNRISQENAKAMGEILKNQADGRESYGRYEAELRQLKESDKEQWLELKEIRKYMWICVGILAAIQFGMKILFKGQ